MISYKRLTQVLHYEAKTGNFYWLVSLGTAKENSEAGSWDDGYLRIRIDGRSYRAHRLAYFYMTKRWAKMVDHKDNNSKNNKWENLREATPSQNAANSKLPAHAKIKFKGVTKRGRYNRYRARIVVAGKELHLGIFSTPQEAHAAYSQAAQKYFGEFARAY